MKLLILCELINGNANSIWTVSIVTVAIHYQWQYSIITGLLITRWHHSWWWADSFSGRLLSTAWSNVFICQCSLRHTATADGMVSPRKLISNAPSIGALDLPIPHMHTSKSRTSWCGQQKQKHQNAKHVAHRDNEKKQDTKTCRQK